MDIFAETIKHETYSEDCDTIHGVYLHGKLERKNGFDLVYLPEYEGYFEYKDDRIEFVDVVFADGTKETAILYFWNSLAIYEKKPLLNIPVEVECRLPKGLICAIDDAEANEYALKKFNEKARFI